MNKIIFTCFLFLLNATCLAQVKNKTDYTRFVNPFIGTDGTGHTFPGPCMPFGMVQPGPDNRDIGWDYTSGYQYRDSLILGFSQTRANGTGISEFGDILLQPVTDERRDNFGLAYRKETEQASPGYYAVQLKNQVKAELTATERVAFHQYTYPGNKARLLLDLQHGLRFLTDSLVLESNVQIVDSSSISGYCHTRNWVDRKYFFTLQFSQPFSTVEELPKKVKENAPRYLFGFKLKGNLLQVKIALSTVSVEGAKENMSAELPHWKFNRVVSLAKKSWNSYLSRIDIEAPVKQKTVFYSCLYRLFLQPSDICDVNGQYRGPDDRIHTAANKQYYSTLSLWDTYRAAHPLYTLIAPERVNGFINTLVEHAKSASFLPIWTAWGQDNYCMIGNHAIPVIADAYMKGFSGFDAEEALEQMVRSSRENHFNSNWTLLNKYGYYPFDSLGNEAVSRTLEHGVDDYCIALMAGKMGKKDIASEFYKRSTYYKNLYDPVTRQLRGKDSRGNWRTPFDPLVATSPMNNPGDYTEANAWQYFWTPAQYDVKGITELLGGKKQFTDQLDSFFSIKAINANKHLGQEAMIGQYAHGNEPSHHIAWLYAYSDTPEKGDRLISRICTEFYNNTPHGMIGNDDCGQMSAWYIFATLGFYPVNPASRQYVAGWPQVSKAAIITANGKKLVLTKKSVTSSRMKLIILNSKSIGNNGLTQQALSAGGYLQFKAN